MSELKQDDNGEWWRYYGNKRQRYYERKCVGCGKTNIVQKSRLYSKCQACGNTGIEWSTESKNKLSKSISGEKHPRYKERIIDKSGYVIRHAPDHPFSTSRDGYIREHRLVMENIIGRKLNRDEVVHHINGIKHDNRPSNLWLFDSISAHNKFHADVDKYTKKSHYIYMAGNISNDYKTYQWRENLETELKEEALYKRVVFVNPCLNEYDKNITMENGLNQIQILKDTAKKTQKILRAKDYKMVSICSIFVVNLELYNNERPMIGTLQEMVWAHDIFYIPILAITGENIENNPYVQHMWLDECCSAKVKTVQEVASLIKDLFVEY